MEAFSRRLVIASNVWLTAECAGIAVRLYVYSSFTGTFLGNDVRCLALYLNNRLLGWLVS